MHRITLDVDDSVYQAVRGFLRILLIENVKIVDDVVFHQTDRHSLS